MASSSISKKLNSLYDAWMADPEAGLDPLIAHVRQVAKRTYRDDDMAQTFAIYVWEHLPDLRENLPCSFGGWIYRQIQWRRVDYYRAVASPEEQVPVIIGMDGDPMTSDEALDSLMYDADDEPHTLPDLEGIDNPFVRKVAGLLIAGNTQDECAEMLGVKPATLRKRLSRYRSSESELSEVLLEAA